MNSTAQDFQALMQVNELSYMSPIDGSLASIRQLKKNLFNPSSYTGGQMQCQAQGGGDMINGPGSYVMADINLFGTNVETIRWNNVASDCKNGSAWNLWREVHLEHRSGREIDRIDNFNALISVLLDYAFDSSFGEKFAKLFGFGDTFDFLADTRATGGFNIGARTYIFPLFLVSGVFAQRALLPSTFFSALKMNITLESAVTATVSTAIDDEAPIIPQYTINNVTLVLDSVDIYDAAKRSILEQSANTASRGLQYSYFSYYNLKKTEQSANLNFDLNISAAKVMQVIIKTRFTTDITNNELNSMASTPYDYARFRFRLGAHVMPLHYVENSAEAYNIAQQAFGGSPDLDLLNQKPVQCGIAYNVYRAPVESTNAGCAVVAMSLERNPIGLLSGTVSNNSMLLNFEAAYGGVSGGASKAIDAWVKHMRVLNIMIDNVVVDK